MDVALGGTFDPIHDGHRALFERAFELGDVLVGLTTQELAANLRPDDRPIRPFADRHRALDAELASYANQYDRAVEIQPLATPTGIASERPSLKYLVVSPETEPTGRKINDQRETQGLAPLTIEVVDHVRANDGKIISSTRIINGEIDEHGRVQPQEQ